jgi:hypothetical protein
MFVQALWADTYKIGCGFTEYSKSDGDHACLYVCNYGPGGNYIGGNMYQVGAPCTECPSNTPKCNDGLCVWGSYVEFSDVIGFGLVEWAPMCLLSLPAYQMSLIQRTRKGQHVVVYMRWKQKISFPILLPPNITETYQATGPTPTFYSPITHFTLLFFHIVNFSVNSLETNVEI